MQIILASASPRRRELLKTLTADFSVVPAVGEEKADASLPPEKYACAIAEAKCAEVFKRFPRALVIGCDTIVVFGDRILGKPRDRADAVATLKMLSGGEHRVITGVCVAYGDKKIVDFESTAVYFNRLTDGFIGDYVNSGSPMDKAGSYGIQDGGLVRDIDGDYDNVVGLPVRLLEKMMEEVL